MLGTFLTAIDWFGMAVFAVTGALVASRKRMDIFGFMLLGCVTGMGGGTLRDAMLGALPVFWVREPVYLAICAGVSAATFFLAHIPESRYRVLLWLDAAGLALFCVVGADRALTAGASAFIAIAMGVVTGTFGGVMRDILGGESPLILRREIYVTAALVGAAVFVGLLALGVGSAHRGVGRLRGVLRHPRARAALRLVAAGVPGAGRADDGGGGAVGTGQVTRERAARACINLDCGAIS